MPRRECDTKEAKREPDFRMQTSVVDFAPPPLPSSSVTHSLDPSFTACRPFILIDKILTLSPPSILQLFLFINFIERYQLQVA